MPDKILQLLVDNAVLHQGPIEPIVDRCIELGLRVMELPDPTFPNDDFVTPDTSLLFYTFDVVQEKVNNMLQYLGHNELADYAPW